MGEKLLLISVLTLSYCIVIEYKKMEELTNEQLEELYEGSKLNEFVKD